jgi:dipeptidase
LAGVAKKSGHLKQFLGTTKIHAPSPTSLRHFFKNTSELVSRLAAAREWREIQRLKPNRNSTPQAGVAPPGMGLIYNGLRHWQTPFQPTS